MKIKISPIVIAALAALLAGTQARAICWSEGCSNQAQERWNSLRAKNSNTTVQASFGEGKQGADAARQAKAKAAAKAKIELRKIDRELKTTGQRMDSLAKEMITLLHQLQHSRTTEAQGEEIINRFEKVETEMTALEGRCRGLEKRKTELETIVEAAKPKQKTSAVVPARPADQECAGRNRSTGAGASGASEVSRPKAAGDPSLTGRASPEALRRGAEPTQIALPVKPVTRPPDYDCTRRN